MLRAFAARFPLTPSGLTALALCGLALTFGTTRQDLVLTLAGAWGLAVVLLAGAAAAVEAVRVRRDAHRAAPARRDRLELVEARPRTTSFRLRRRWRPLAAEPEWTWDRPAAGVRADESDTLAEVVIPHSRGIASRVWRRFTVTDAFGLWRLSLRVEQDRAAISLPHAGALSEADVATCLASGDLLSHPHGPAEGDRVDFRTYNRSDPARLILWKVYARSRQLLVRTPEPARTPDTRPLVYLVTGAKDDAAAGVARLLMESGLLGTGARFATDGSPEPVSAIDAVRESLAASIRERHRGGADLAAALASPGVEAGDPVVLVCPAHDGAWIRRAVRQVARHPDRFLVIAAGDGRPARARRSVFEAVVWRPDPFDAAGASPAAMLRACRPLASTGARVVLADRATGALTRVTGAWSPGETRAALAGAGA